MCSMISDAFASNPLDVGSYLDASRSRSRPCVDAAEFLDERADVCRLLEFHDLAAPKPEHVHPSEIHKATRSLLVRPPTLRPLPE